MYYVYFMTNPNNNVLYIGVTSDLNKRVLQHKNHMLSLFSDKYNCDKCVYYEEFQQIMKAIEREKQLKGWKREWKNHLVNQVNPDWCDLL